MVIVTVAMETTGARPPKVPMRQFKPVCRLIQVTGGANPPRKAEQGKAEGF